MMQRKLSGMTMVLILIGSGLLLFGFYFGLNHDFLKWKEMSGIIQMACLALFFLVLILWFANWKPK